MKTTVEIDQQKLKKVMKLTGIKTQKQAIAFALDQAERIAKVQQTLKGHFYIDEDSDIFDEKYDLNMTRKLDIERI